MNGWFVTGTDTGVGKTLVACALLQRLRQAGQRVAGMKPVAAGCRRAADGLRNDDAEALIAAAGTDHPYATVNPYAFELPIAPHLAAAAAGMSIEIDRIADCFRTLAAGADTVVVEGAGGWLVPLDGRRTMADLASALDLDAVLVVGLRLGCLNHALLTAASIAAHGRRLAGWVACDAFGAVERADQQVAALCDRLAAPCWGRIPRLAEASPQAALQHLKLEVGRVR